MQKPDANQGTCVLGNSHEKHTGNKPSLDNWKSTLDANMVTVKQETKNIKTKNAKLIALAKDPKTGAKVGAKPK